MTNASEIAFNSLRQSKNFQWAMVPVFALVAQLYWKEIGKRNWHFVLACAGTIGLEFFAEILNALLLHFTDYAALWTIGGNSTYLVFVGLNLEIMLMFWVAYYAFLKILPSDARKRIWGIPNRWFFVVFNALFCMTVESILNQWGALVWQYRFWSWPHVWSVFMFAYAPSIIFLYWLYDMPSLRRKFQITAGLWALCGVSGVLFVKVLHWI
jgi:hypothetical protein